MKSKILFLVATLNLSLLNFSDVFSQSKYGKITMEEMTMNSYPLDTTATAVILSKVGDARFIYNDLYGFQFENQLTMKIKILKPEGLKYCQHIISYYEQNNQSKEAIIGLSGTTYNLENGKITKTKLGKDFIVDEDQDEKYKIKKITMPAAKVGSVIEYKYTIRSDFFRDFRDFYFQSSIPTAYVLYDVTIPEYFNYSKSTLGYEKINSEITNVNETFSVKVGRGMEQVRCTAERGIFKGVDIPAMKDETHLWTKEDYISKISYELRSIQFPMSTVTQFAAVWGDVDKELRERSRFGGELKKKGLFKDEIAPGELTLEKATEIQNLVKSKVKWNNSNTFLVRNLKDALKDGIGASADINFLLINALKAGGFEAYPVVLSTRSNGRLPIGRPSATAFNYVIVGVQIDDKIYYTDASDEYGDWNILPAEVMVPQARVIKDNFADWVDLTAVSTGRSVVMGNIFVADNSVKKQIKEAHRGMSGRSFRYSFYKGHKDQDEFVEKLANNLNGEIEDFKIQGIDKTNQDVNVEYILKKDEALDDILYLNPMLRVHFEDNPFKTEERRFPINFSHLDTYSQVATIEIPEGYAIEELPKSEKFVFGDNGGISFTYMISKTGNMIQLQYHYQVKTLLILPDAYADLRDFFSKIVQKNSEQIVLKKIAD